MAETPKDAYVSIAQWGNCKVCGAWKDLRYGTCFPCSDFVDGIEIPGGYEFWDSRNTSVRWKVQDN